MESESDNVLSALHKKKALQKFKGKKIALDMITGLRVVGVLEEVADGFAYVTSEQNIKYVIDAAHIMLWSHSDY